MARQRVRDFSRLKSTATHDCSVRVSVSLLLQVIPSHSCARECVGEIVAVKDEMFNLHTALYVTISYLHWRSWWPERFSCELHVRVMMKTVVVSLVGGFEVEELAVDRSDLRGLCCSRRWRLARRSGAGLGSRPGRVPLPDPVMCRLDVMTARVNLALSPELTRWATSTTVCCAMIGSSLYHSIGILFTGLTTHTFLFLDQIQ